jgi:hypothetical protein
VVAVDRCAWMQQFLAERVLHIELLVYRCNDGGVLSYEISYFLVGGFSGSLRE